MPKRAKESNKKSTLDLNKFCKSARTVGPNSRSVTDLVWTAGDAFGSQLSSKSCGNSSKSSELSAPAMRRQHSNGSLNGCKGSANKSKHLSRFVTHLSESIESIESDLSHNMSEIESIETTSDEMPIVIDSSSPILEPLPTISSDNSPKSLQIDRKESIEQIIQKSFINYFDKPIDKLRKFLSNRSKDKSCDTSLRTKTLNVLNGMKRSRLEFSQRDSLRLRDGLKSLLLKVTKIETIFGISYLHSVVIEDQNNEFPQNSSIVLVFNHKIVDGLDLSTGYTIRVFRHWTQLHLMNQIYILNAFNVEFDECFETMVGHNTQDIDYTIIWQKEMP